MAKRVVQKNLITANALFNRDDDDPEKRIDYHSVHNLITVISLDAAGNPVIPTGGVYNIFVKTANNSGFRPLQDNGALDATLTGGSAMADGLEQGASFALNPHEIKVVPTGVVGAVSYVVIVDQNHG